MVDSLKTNYLFFGHYTFAENIIEQNLNLNKEVNKIMPNITCSRKTLNLDNSSKNTKFKRFRTLRGTNFLMIPLIFLYYEYIDRPKLTEQKNPFEYIVPPPKRGGTIKKVKFSSSKKA